MGEIDHEKLTYAVAELLTIRAQALKTQRAGDEEATRIYAGQTVEVLNSLTPHELRVALCLAVEAILKPGMITSDYE